MIHYASSVIDSVVLLDDRILMSQSIEYVVYLKTYTNCCNNPMEAFIQVYDAIQ